MLDEEHRHTVGRRQAVSRSAKCRSRLRRAPKPARRAGGPWVEWQGPGRAPRVGQTGRQRVSAFVGDVTQADTVEDLVRLLRRAGGAVVRPASADLGRRLDVLTGGQRAEDLESLERPGHAEVRPLVRAGGGDVVALERDLPAVGSWSPVITLNVVVLPAPFGPMRPVIVAFFHPQGHLVHGHVPAEADADLIRLQNRHDTPQQPSRARDRALGSVRPWPDRRRRPTREPAWEAARCSMARAPRIAAEPTECRPLAPARSKRSRTFSAISATAPSGFAGEADPDEPWQHDHEVPDRRHRVADERDHGQGESRRTAPRRPR